MFLTQILAAAEGEIGTARITAMLDRLHLMLLGIMAALAVLMLTVAAIRYMTAGGDPAGIERAKATIKATFIGLAIAGLADVLVNLAKRAFQA